MKKLIFALLMCVPCTAWGAIASGTCTFGPGGTYPDLAAFEADLAATLTGSVTAQCYTTYTDTTPVTFAGTTTSESNRIYVISTAANRCKMAPTTGENAIRIEESYVTIDGIEVDASDGITGTAINMVNVNYCMVKNCILYDGPSRGISTGSWGYNYVVNTIAHGFTAQWQSGISGGAADILENNTVYGNYYGIAMSGADTSVLRNNASFGNTDECFFGDNTCYGYNNCSSDTTGANGSWTSSGGTGNITGATFADNFTSTTDFHLKSTSPDCLDAGATPTYASLDYEGDSIYNSTRDIGADEYVPAGGGTPSAFPQILIFQ